MKTIALAAALGLIALPAVADPNNWAEPAAPFHLMGNTYSVGSAGVTAFLLTTRAGEVLIDVGLVQNADMVERNIQALGFHLKDVKIILVSHGHYDHAGGLAKVKADTGALLISSEPERYALEKGVYPGSESVKKFQFPPVKVDRTVKDGESVKLGGLKITAHLTPGHTQGCTSWTWPLKDTDGSAHTAIDFCSAKVGNNRLVPEQYPGIVADYQRTFATAKSLPGDVFLEPHTEVFDADAKRAKLGRPGPNPFIDRPGYERMVDDQRALFETALQAQRQKAAASP